MTYPANKVWEVWSESNSGATVSVTNEILNVVSPAATYGSKYVFVHARGGDKVRFDLMARSVSGVGRLYIDLGGIGGTSAVDLSIQGHNDFKSYSVECVVPYVYAVVDIYVGVGCASSDAGEIEAINPKLSINGSFIDLIPAYGVGKTSSGGVLRCFGYDVINVKNQGSGNRRLSFTPNGLSGDEFFTMGSISPALRAVGNNNENSAFGLACFDATAGNGTTIRHLRSRATVMGGYAATQSSDPLGGMDFWGDDGAAYRRSARLDVVQDGAASGAFVPGKIQFKTTSTTAADQIRLVIASDGVVRPGSDNTQSIGAASYRWSVVYAGTGAINTSDERIKTFSEISEAEIIVAKKLKGMLRKFQFNDAIENKGQDGARYHFGVGAQSVAKAFEDAGLDPSRYALFCYDKWDSQPEIKDEEGNVVNEYLAAGNRYGIRYDELLAFIVSAL